MNERKVISLETLLWSLGALIALIAVSALGAWVSEVLHESHPYVSVFAQATLHGSLTVAMPGFCPG